MKICVIGLAMLVVLVLILPGIACKNREDATSSPVNPTGSEVAPSGAILTSSTDSPSQSIAARPTTPEIVPGSATNNNQLAVFPDLNLESAIREAIGKPSGEILPSDCGNLTSLDAGEDTSMTLLAWSTATN